MMGPKKLSTIRMELRQALAATGTDPIRWLEERMTSLEHQGAPTRDESEVLQSLRRLLEEPRKSKLRKRQAGAKK
jgi:hypothetical protein